MLNFGCSKPKAIEPVEQEPQPQPEQKTAIVNIYVNKLFGDEAVSGPAVELWQDGKKEADGMLENGYVQLKLTKDFTPNSSNQYDFGNYQARFTDGYGGYVDVISPDTKILVTEGGSTEMGLKMVNEGDIDVSNYRYAWRFQAVNACYKSPSQITVNINRTDWDGTGKEFPKIWMDKFREFFVKDDMPKVITGFIENVIYNDDTNVTPGDPGIDGEFNNFYMSALPFSAGSVSYPSGDPSSPVLRGNCLFESERIPDSYIYAYIRHEFVDSLIRGDQDDFNDWLKKCKWTFGRPNGSELHEGYEDLPGWVEVIDGNTVVRGYTLMTLNPEYREFEAWDPFRHGILSDKREPKYKFKKIKPEETGQRGKIRK